MAEISARLGILSANGLKYMKRFCALFLLTIGGVLFGNVIEVGVSRKSAMSESFMLAVDCKQYILSFNIESNCDASVDILVDVVLYDKDGEKIHSVLKKISGNSENEIFPLNVNVAKEGKFSENLSILEESAVFARIEFKLSASANALVKISNIMLGAEQCFDEFASPHNNIAGNDKKFTENPICRNMAVVNGVDVFSKSLSDSDKNDFLKLDNVTKTVSQIEQKNVYYVDADLGNDSYSGKYALAANSMGPKRTLGAALEKIKSDGIQKNEIVLCESSKTIYAPAKIFSDSEKSVIIKPQGKIIIGVK